MLFTHHCAACDRTQLIFPSQAHGVASTDRGTELSFTCWCGADQVRVIGREFVTAV